MSCLSVTIIIEFLLANSTEVSGENMIVGQVGLQSNV